MILNSNFSEKVRYSYDDCPVYLRQDFISDYHAYSGTVHWHEDVEFIIVLSGNICYKINGCKVNLSKNEGVFVNARQMHFGFSSDKSECSFICARLSPLLLCSIPSFEENFASPILNNPDIPYIKLSSNVPWQYEICRLIRSMYSAKNEKSAPLKIQSYFFKVWALIYENADIRSKGSPKADLAIIKNMIDFIGKNYEKKIMLSDIAASGAVGQSKCCALFSEFLGQTPGEYLLSQRLGRSAYLLRSTDMTITEIALSVGFCTGSYYAEIFKRYYNKTPTDYRKGLLK